ncbi:hypothetical protein HY218_00980 [Candidatus Saccharibacteria bacterium]|nr:hypothetical protein [Candidatus Saccharibacteria bacterium]
MSKNRERPLLRKAANALTDTRFYGSFLLAGEVAVGGRSFRNWKIAAQAGLLMVTDNLDGWLGRMSNIPSVEYTTKDEQRDKTLYRHTMTAIGVATEDPRYLIYSGLTDVRNGLVEKERAKLRTVGLSAGARPLGKLKTSAQNLALLIDLSPLGDSNAELVHRLHQSALGLTAVSGAEIIIDAKHKLSQHFQTATTDNQTAA